jgi:hypothetical protein
MAGLLDGQVAIITGAGQGLGKAIALELTQEGAAVVLLEINPNTLQQTQSEIAAMNQEARIYPLDITDYSAYAQVKMSSHGRARLTFWSTMQPSRSLARFWMTRYKTGASRWRLILKHSIWAASWSRRTWSSAAMAGSSTSRPSRGLSPAVTLALTTLPKAASSRIQNLWRWNWVNTIFWSMLSRPALCVLLCLCEMARMRLFRQNLSNGMSSGVKFLCAGRPIPKIFRERWYSWRRATAAI